MTKKERDEKRRDSKGRLLKSGESQRADGKYAYKYTDTFGETKFVYSWKLVPSIKILAGKRADISLREKIKQIQKGLDLIGAEALHRQAKDLPDNGGGLVVDYPLFPLLAGP